ncbi:hypothetical protein CK203_045343 [Vitis vinifera]|uniref:Uncharacterized protein n=1 Tax=Vitis vinifera TaxID=29760 RepID=A0A438H970_VITVI|nr:hypothetical protein CK203_045343 [Vitis vinifera]
MPVKKDIASTSVVMKGGRTERFCILSDISVHLVHGDPTSTEKEARDAIFFIKE